MTVKGHITNGIIVLDEPTQLPEGAVCTITFPTPAPSPSLANPPQHTTSLTDLVRHDLDLPEDAAENIDHYLYCHPKAGK